MSNPYLGIVKDDLLESFEQVGNLLIDPCVFEERVDGMFGRYFDEALNTIAHKLGVDKNFIKAKFEPIDSYTPKSEQGVFVICAGPDEIAEFTLISFPGCCGIVVSAHAYVLDKYRQLGIGSLLNKLRQQIAKEWGYSILMCTDVENNVPQQKILANNGWDKLKTFVNKRTGNKVCIHTIALQ